MRKAKNTKKRAKSAEVGIRCRKCGDIMGVYKTFAEENEIRRIRKCGKCSIFRVTHEH
jgi:hypothetical protein